MRSKATYYKTFQYCPKCGKFIAREWAEQCEHCGHFIDTPVVFRPTRKQGQQ